MGGSSWSDTVYRSSVKSKFDSHGTAFVYDMDVKAGKARRAAHDDLNPFGVKVRESRDSDAHPESNAIVVALDITGSMGRCVRQIHEKLPSLMGLLTRKNYIDHPQIMFVAVGDATCDAAPLQVGQFESGAEMEGDLSKFFIEGGGGGGKKETYELAAFFGARHTSIDCMEKRSKKGYFFFIGDEACYAQAERDLLKKVMDVDVQSSISTMEIFAELKKKYDVFCIRPMEGSYSSGRDKEDIEASWNEYLDPQHLLHLDKTDYIAELIATQVGICEGTIDMAAAAKDLKDEGADDALIKSVSTALSKGYAGGAVAKVSGEALTTKGTSSIERL